jgi:hypothetical protein
MDKQQASTSTQQLTLSSLPRTTSSSSLTCTTSSSSSRTKVTGTSSVLFITERLVDITIEQGKLLKLLVESSQSLKENTGRT